jgi:hypothetical protein
VAEAQEAKHQTTYGQKGIGCNTVSFLKANADGQTQE